MKSFILTTLIAVFTISLTKGYTHIDTQEDCDISDLKEKYQKAVFPLIVLLYKSVAKLSNLNFVFSPNSIWLTLAAIAEGSGKQTQEQLFKLLNLPDDQCLRQKYYDIASSRASPLYDVSIVQTRTILIDVGVTLNATWANFVTKNCLLDVVTAPIKGNPVFIANEDERTMAENVARLNKSSNSVLLDVTDYNGLWTTAFANAVIERSPFYDQTGEEIGAVDLMKTKLRARMGYIKSLNAKILELPLGANHHYRMLFVHIIGKKGLAASVTEVGNDIMSEMFNSLKLSNVPIDVAIPRVNLLGEVDMRAILEDLGVTSPWTDEDATKFISNPPALPSSFIQHASITFDKYGVSAPPFEPNLHGITPTGLDPEVGREFIANQPFLMGLFDAETYTPILTVAFTKPTYSLYNLK